MVSVFSGLTQHGRETYTDRPDRPVHLALVYLLTLTLLGHFAQRLLPDVEVYNNHDEDIQLYHGQNGILDRVSNHRLVKYATNSIPVEARKQMLALVIALGVRIVTFKQLTRHAECLTLTVAISSIVRRVLLIFGKSFAERARLYYPCMWHSRNSSNQTWGFFKSSKVVRNMLKTLQQIAEGKHSWSESHFCMSLEVSP